MTYALEIFELEPSNYTDLTKVERENAALYKIWSIKKEWDAEWVRWKEIAFQELKANEEVLTEMDERAVEIKMKLDNLESQEKKWKITEFINDKIRVFRDTIPLIEDLRHESMRDRHWKELRIEVKEDFDEEDDSFNVEKIFDL